MFEPRELQKQVLQTVKMIFKTTMDSIDSVQTQLEKFLDLTVSQTTGLQDQYTKLVKEWMQTAKKMREEFKKMTEEFLKKLEAVGEEKK